MENNVLQRLAVVRRLGVLKRHVCRAVFGEPCARLVDGSVEDKTATIHEEHALRKLERPLDALLGENEGTPEGVQHLEERLRAGRVELRRRLVQQQQVRMHRQSRGQANALELASRELRGPPRGQRQRPYGGERPFDPSSDLGSRHAGVLEPERHLVGHGGHDDLVFGILEHARDPPGEVGRSPPTRVEPADEHRAFEPASVEMRHERCKRTKEGRLARARRAEECDPLAWIDPERHLGE